MKSVEVRNLRLILQLGKPNRKSDRCPTHRILLIHTTDGGEGHLLNVHDNVHNLYLDVDHGVHCGLLIYKGA